MRASKGVGFACVQGVLQGVGFARGWGGVIACGMGGDDSHEKYQVERRFWSREVLVALWSSPCAVVKRVCCGLVSVMWAGLVSVPWVGLVRMCFWQGCSRRGAVQDVGTSCQCAVGGCMQHVPQAGLVRTWAGLASTGRTQVVRFECSSAGGGLVAHLSRPCAVV